jgi:hypothetical protein
MRRIKRRAQERSIVLQPSAFILHPSDPSAFCFLPSDFLFRLETGRHAKSTRTCPGSRRR